MNNLTLFNLPTSSMAKNKQNLFPWSNTVFDPFERIFTADMNASNLSQIYEEEDNFIIEAQVPGVRKDDLNISVENGVLSIETKVDSKKDKKKDKSDNKEDKHRLPSRSYNFKFTIPEEIKIEEIQAKLAYGILTLTIPKPSPNQENHNRKFIEISEEVA